MIYAALLLLSNIGPAMSYWQLLKIRCLLIDRIVTKHRCGDTALKRSWCLSYRKYSQMLTRCWFLVDIVLTKTLYFSTERVPYVAIWYWPIIDLITGDVDKRLMWLYLVDIAWYFRGQKFILYVFSFQVNRFLLINCWYFVDVRKKCWHFVYNLFCSKALNISSIDLFFNENIKHSNEWPCGTYTGTLSRLAPQPSLPWEECKCTTFCTSSMHARDKSSEGEEVQEKLP